MAPIIATVLTGIGSPEVGTQMVNIIFLVILFSVLFSTVVAGIMSTRYVQDMGKEEKPPKPKEPEEPKQPKEPEKPREEKFLEEAEQAVG